MKAKYLFLLLMVSLAAKAGAETPAEVQSSTPTPAAVETPVVLETQTSTPTPVAVQAAAPTPAPATPPDPDGGWPRKPTSESGASIQLFQPQVESWKDQKTLVAWAAVEFLGTDMDKSQLGVVKWEAQTSVSKESRLVRLNNLIIKQVNFPTLTHGQSRETTAAIGKVFPKDGLEIALDRVMAAMDKSAIRTDGVKINAAPPPIFYSRYTAFLVQFDGEPILSPIKGSPLKYVVNTNWDVILDEDKKLYYMRYEKHWLSATAVDKKWTATNKVPESFSTIPTDENWADVRAAIPPKGLSVSKTPQIYVSKQPAELIVTKGKPQRKQVAKKSNLYWIENTECDLFQYKKKGPYYFLVSGRWFRSEKLEGPWTFASADLPPDFLEIPRTHPRARVRASVPGTDEATEAVLLAQIPQTLRITRKGLDIPEVKYSGEPDFKKIEGLKVYYAVNSSNDVLKVNDIYYLCFQGAWFKSTKPAGPWALATAVPEDIYKIPADNPMHHVTYVRIDSWDTDTVTYAYDSGYTGVTVAFGVAMWGTGYYYPPYYGGGIYYPYPYSYGSYAVYNPRTGAYGYGSSVSGPNGGISHAATYNPNTGTYARGTAAYGPDGGKMKGQAYNPRTGTSATTRQGKNSQGNWGTTKVSRGDDWAQRGHVTTDKGTISGTRTSEGNGVIRGKGEDGSGFVGKKGDDIYAGKDGNVYKKTDDGWQQHTENGWSDVDRNRPETKDLNREANRRAEGNARTRDRSGPSASDRSANRGSGSRGGGSYSGGSRGGSRGGGGGGSRGGGGRGGGGGRRR